MSLLSSLRKTGDKAVRTALDRNPSSTTSLSATSSPTAGGGGVHYNYPRTINWYPGHMVKAQRMLESNFLRRAHIILEIRDSRIPISSMNHHLEPLIGRKPRLVVFNKADLLTTPQKKKLLSYISRNYRLFTNQDVAECDDPILDSNSNRNRYHDEDRNDDHRTGALLGDSRGDFSSKRICSVLKLMASSEQKWRSLPLMVAVLGFPNVGKSTMINSLRTLHRIRGSAATGKMAGITRHISAFKICHYPLIHVLDTPGIYMPALKMQSDRDVDCGMKLALCGCLKDDVVGILEIADYLLWRLNHKTMDQLAVSKYKAFCGVDQQFENIEALMHRLAVKKGLFYQRHDPVTGLSFESKEHDIHAAALLFVEEYRKGLLERHILDDLEPRDVEQCGAEELDSSMAESECKSIIDQH